MASTGRALSRLTTMARPATWSRSAGWTTDSGASPVNWLGRMFDNFPNQKSATAVSTLPLSGMGVGRTTSKADSRSVVTMSMRLSSMA
jgi:hypothetical protein